MTLICPSVSSLQSMAAVNLAPATSILTLMRSSNAIDDNAFQRAGQDLKDLEYGWNQHRIGSGSFVANESMEILSDREEMIAPRHFARFGSLNTLVEYLNGSFTALSLAETAFGVLGREFAMTVLAHHLGYMNGSDLRAAMLSHKGLQLYASDISYLLYSANVTSPNAGEGGSALYFSPLRLWEDVGEIYNREGQIIPLNNGLLMAEALYRMSLGQSYDGEAGLYTGTDLAFSFVDGAIALYPNHAAALYQRAKLEGEDVNVVFDLLGRALKVDPNYFDAWESMANAYEISGMPHEAKECWEDVLYIVDQREAAEERLGFFTGALPSDEKRPVFQLKLAALCEALGENERAMYHYNEVRKRSNGDFRVPEQILPGSDERLEPAIVFFRMGQIFQREGFAEEAKARFDMAIQLDPRLASVYDPQG